LNGSRRWTLAKHIFLATPTHGGGVSAEYVASLFATQAMCLTNGIAVTHSLCIGNALIHDARNRMVAWFKASEATDMFFIDDDIAWRAEDFLRLATSPHDVIGGAYRQKREDSVMFNVSNLAPGPTRLLTCDYTGTGFLKISRKAIDKLWKINETYQDLDGHECRGLFEAPIADGKITGEDAVFCRKWRETGGRVFIDPDCELTHFGRKGYQGSLAAMISDHEKAA